MVGQLVIYLNTSDNTRQQLHVNRIRIVLPQVSEIIHILVVKEGRSIRCCARVLIPTHRKREVAQENQRRDK